MFGFRKNTILNNYGIKRFIRIFARRDNWHHLDVGTGNLGYGWIHYSLIRNLKPKNILCIGSKYGFIPSICALACKDNGFGKVDFVDAGFDIKNFSGPDVHWGGVGFWKKCHPKKYFSKFGLGDYIDLYVMTSSDFSKKFFKKKYDYVYLDGDHSYSGVKNDFDLFWKKLNKRGFLVLHDISSPDKDGNVYGTRKLWSEIKKNNKVAFEFAQDPGLGVIQKF